MPLPKKRLRNVVIQEVSLVDKGDNPPARVLLFKRRDDADQKPGLVDRVLALFGSSDSDAEIEKRILEEVRTVPEFMKQTPGEGTQEDSMDLSKLSKEDRDVVEAAITAAAEVDGLKEQIATQSARVAELEAAATSQGGTEDPVQKAIANLPDEVRKQVEAKLAKRDEEQAAMQKRLDELVEKDARTEFAKTVGDLSGLAGKREEHIDRLWKIKDAEARAELQKTLEAAAAAVQRGGIFQEYGSGAEGSAGAEGVLAKVAAAAAEIRKVKPELTAEQAESQALRADPRLYAEYLSETGAH